VTSIAVIGHKEAKGCDIEGLYMLNTKRRALLICGLVVLAAIIASDLYEFFLTNDGVGYYVAEPWKFVYVVMIAVAGGMTAWGISRLAPASQRKLKLTALGGFGILLVGAMAWSGYLLYLFAVTPFDASRVWPWIAATLFCAGAAAVLVWLEFQQVCKRTPK